MYCRFFYCLALLPGLWATRPVAAQAVNWPIYTGFYLQGGGSYFAGLKLDSYEQYRESFNTIFKTRLRTPLGAWVPQFDYSFGGGAYIGPAYFSVVKHRMRVSSMAEYLNGDRREMILDYNPLDLNIDLMFPVGGRVVLGAAIGGQLQNVTVHSGYRYAVNGLLSYGEEQPFDGIFRQKVNGSMLLGARLDLKLIKLHDHSFITLSLRGENVGVLRHFVEGSDPNVNPLRDEMMAQATGGPTFDDGTLRYYLPEDVRKGRDVYTTFVGLNPTFASTLHGWRFSANLLLTPFERKLNH